MTSSSPQTREIVVGLDGSRAAQLALAWAANEAAARHAPLNAVTVHPHDIDEPTWPSIDAVGRDSEWTQGSITVTRLVHDGDPAEVLCREARHADLLVLGSSGRGIPIERILGSVTRDCLRQAECPVVVLGLHAQPEPVRRLLVSPTLDPRAETVPWVHAWIQHHGVPVHILSSFVVDDPPSLTRQHQTREDVLDASAREQESWSRRLFELDVTDVTSHLVEGDPLDVVRWHTEPGDLLLLPADFDHRYSIAHGLCPVLIAPTASRKVNLADKIARDAVTSDA